MIVDRRRTWPAIASLVLVACGGAEPSAAPKAPAADSPPPAQQRSESEAAPRTVAEAQDEIARARAELDRGLGKTAVGDERPPEPKTEPPPKGAGTAPSSSGATEKKPTPDARREERSADRCEHPCRALSSMKRAVDALCRLTGDTDTRCAEAKRTLSESETRVAGCKCAEAH